MTQAAVGDDLLERVALVRCPFCGGKRITIERALDKARFGICEKCYACGPEGKTNDQAIEAWNSRAAIASVPPVPIDDGLRTALLECREMFAFYVRHHEAKMRGASDSYERANLQDKVRRNQKMVDLCDAALHPNQPEQEND
jgi:Lar family restriction alleviation protein